MIPQAYVYPPEMRATRDLLRRRNHLMRKRSELIAHIQNTLSQYNLAPLEHRVQKRCDREGLLSHFPDPQVKNSVALDLAMIEQYDALPPKLERHIRACRQARPRCVLHAQARTGLRRNQVLPGLTSEPARRA
jgi:hypothetical protein